MISTKSERTWADFVQIRSRYQRSVHLQRDAQASDWLDGYIVTPLGRSLLARMGHGLQEGGTARSWSITGPYGSGKSAFALFLSQVMATEGLGDSKIARRLLSKADKPLKHAMFGAGGVLPKNEGLCPVLATGDRRPLEVILLTALLEASRSYWNSRGKPSIVEELADAVEFASSAESPSATDVVAFYERVALQVRKSKKPGRGLLVVLDEAGKALEHIVASRGQGDIHLLQELAEAANRSGDTPIVFVVLLHQAFDNYVARLSASHRNEWMKVQGRFEDVPFQEPADQVLRLIGAAIEVEELPQDMEQRSSQAAGAVSELCNKRLRDRSADLEGSLRETAPLHPACALVLGPLFRSKLAQNERSLFAFLGSAEPRGLQEFLNNTQINGSIAMFGLSNLYDYVVSTYGGRLYGSHSRIWAQIDTALHRLPTDAEAVDARIVKSVGLLSLLGEAAGLTPSLEVIHEAVWGGGKTKLAKTRKALDRLQSASILVFRKFKSAFQLWDGSDLDLDSLIDEARVDSSPYANLATRLSRIAPPRPLVARRHIHETGTFRYFEVRYADERLVLEDQDFVPEDCVGDGVLWIVLPTSDRAEAEVHRALELPHTWSAMPNPRPVLVGLPTRRGQLVHLLDDLAAIEVVEANTHALQSDPVARRELSGRRDESLHLLREELQEIMTTGGNAHWFAKERESSLATTINTESLTSTLSKLCESAYDHAPVIKSELLNRGQLSSAAAAARRVLMAAMVEAAEKERLGFTGFPPEFSMYRSLLEYHGMHVESADGWTLSAPKRKKVGGLLPAWRELDRFLKSRGDEKVCLTVLYKRLSAPPFGLKQGVLPVIILGYLLVNQDTIALFEDRTFYPNIDSPFLERTLRSPHTVEVQHIDARGTRAGLIEDMSPIILGAQVDRKASTLEVARFLIRATNDLPDYARQTNQLPKKTLTARTALLHAKDPARLIYRQLPEALGIPPIEASRKTDKKAVESLIRGIRSALQGLHKAYPDLLKKIRASVAEAFETGSSPADVRKGMVTRASITLPKGTNDVLRTFMVRVKDETPALDEWTESIATLLVGKPPKYWFDRDLDEFQLRVGRLAIDCTEMEAMAFGAASTSGVADGTLLRVSVQHNGAKADHRIVPTDATASKPAKAMLKTLKKQLESKGSGLTTDEQLAVLARLCEDLISKSKSS